ncbi:MAG: sigma-70 family RNA polymerase sigma factor [Phycisphaerae bacterium]|nr:sigma-70 family RNA polymerase sigma factor [Phycisphaerae bacterium]
MTTTTALLAVLVHEGDDVAWTEFVRRYQPILVAVGLRLGLREPDAVDITQQTLLEFVRDLRRGAYDRSRGRLRNWLLTIANHRVRDHQRALARQDGVPRVPAAPSMIESERLEQVWESEERRALLAEAMLRLRGQTSLDERTIRAFELTALRGVPPETVAQECAMSVAQVYVARNRAATRLREIVGELEAVYSEGVGSASSGFESNRSEGAVT